MFEASERIDVPPPGREAIEAVIRKPAAALGVRFEAPKMVPFIAEATARETGSLPLLSYMMSEAWEAMRRDEAADGTLRFAPGIVDVAAPLIIRAERFLTEHPGHENNLRRLFTLRLAHVAKEGEPVRRRATQEECDPTEWLLAQELASADWRLLTASDQSGVPAIEVAHEALLRRWPRLTAWLDQAREFLIWKGQVEGARREWEVAREPDKDQALLMGLALATGRRWMEERRPEIPAAERTFIERSIAADDTRKAARTAQEQALAEERARSAKRRLWIAWLAGASAAIFAVLGGLAFWQNRSLEAQLFETAIEQARVRMASAAELVRNAEFDTALAVAAAAFPEPHRARWHEIESRTGSSAAVARSLIGSSLGMVARGHEHVVTSAAFSPDGRWIVTASRDGTARVWEAASGAETACVVLDAGVTALSCRGGAIALSDALGRVHAFDIVARTKGAPDDER